MSVTGYLEERCIPYDAFWHEQTYTSIAEARALGFTADEVLKTLVVTTKTGPVLIVIPASRRLDMLLVRKALGDDSAALMSEDQIERDFPEYELGALPPLGALLHVPQFVDSEVIAHRTVVFAAGSRTESVRLDLPDLLRDQIVTLAPLASHASVASSTAPSA
jgi:Ala-tRNA(Pro) deacylase